MEGFGNIALLITNDNDDPPQLQLKDIMGNSLVWKGQFMHKAVSETSITYFQSGPQGTHHWSPHLVCRKTMRCLHTMENFEEQSSMHCMLLRCKLHFSRYEY
jgi:hypothetical protein